MLNTIKKQILAAIDDHVNAGGKLLSHGWFDPATGACCPMTLLSGVSSDELRAADALDHSRIVSTAVYSKMNIWPLDTALAVGSFASAFDGNIDPRRHVITRARASAALGAEIRAYVDAADLPIVRAPSCG